MSLRSPAPATPTTPTTRLPPPHTLVVSQPSHPPPIQISSAAQPSPGMGIPTSPPTSAVTNRGALIVLEGCEDGTSLQSTKLFEFLKNEGFKAALWKFPDVSTPSGSALKAYQTSGHQPHPKTLHLLVSAHWWELMPIMKDHLLNGTTLIVDRYVYSAIAASTASGLDLNWCKNSYVQLLSPDLIFLLKMNNDKEQPPSSSPQQPHHHQPLPHVHDVFGISSNNVEQKRMQEAFSRLAEVQWKVSL